MISFSKNVRGRVANLKILKILKSIIFWVISPISIFILTLSFYVLITTIQSKLLLPREYIIWTFKYPFSVLIFIYEYYIIFGFFYVFNKSFREFIVFNFNKNFIKNHRKSVFSYGMSQKRLYDTVFMSKGTYRKCN